MAGNNWSMTVHEVVSQSIDEDAILPCHFTTPYKDYQDKITVIWRTTTHYHGPIIFQCVSNGNATESEQNCTGSIGRYSLAGNPRQNNASLRIKNISYVDVEKYFCRVELNKKQETYETEKGTSLNIHVPQSLERIYLRTLPSGEQFVTCEVKGRPSPKVEWIVPENISDSRVSVHSGFARALSSIPANLPSTNYTCRVHVESGLQHLSFYYSRAQEQQHGIYPTFFIVFVILSGVFLVLLVLLTMFYKQKLTEPVDSSPMNFTNCMHAEKDQDIYGNI
ncbi:sialic acid-binding Ig-like lectin 15 [Hoplias malabaricus]|uniref:sialic acid-binding Ig-like lectin 15 n=1 Tax=Hoplias malabaricus TaxID=27720 RepID=UPI00346244DD